MSIDVNWSERINELCYIGGIFNSRGVEELVESMDCVNSKLNLAGNYAPLALRDTLMSKRVGEMSMNLVLLGELKLWKF